MRANSTVELFCPLSVTANLHVHSNRSAASESQVCLLHLAALECKLYTSFCDKYPFIIFAPGKRVTLHLFSPALSPAPLITLCFTVTTSTPR